MTIDLSKASPVGRAIAQSILDRKAGDARLTVSISEAQVMLGNVSDSLMTKLFDTNKVQSFIVGGKRAVLVESLYDYLAESALFSYPADEPPRKLHRPVHDALAERRARGKPVKGLSGDAITREHKAEKAKPEPFRSTPLA